MTARSSLEIVLRCEFRTPDDTPCPVRFSWIGPARDSHTDTTRAEDTLAAIDRAEGVGWWLGSVTTACPRHAARTEGAPDA